MNNIKEKLQEKKIEQIEKINEYLKKIENSEYSLKELEKSAELDLIHSRLNEIKMLVKMNSLL